MDEKSETKWTAEAVIAMIRDPEVVTRAGVQMTKGEWFAMRSVCALYRMQTVDEQKAKETRHSNKVGFSSAHAWKGSDMARWMCKDATDNLMRRPLGVCQTTFGTWKNTGKPRVWWARELCQYFAENYAKQLAKMGNDAIAAKKAADEKAAKKTGIAKAVS